MSRAVVKLTAHTGDSYVGNMEGSKRQGLGVLTWGDGNQFDGNWDNNLLSGHGVLYRKDKMIAEEDWKGGCFMSDKECVISVLVPESACR